MSFEKSYDNISKDLLEKIKSITSEKKSLYEKTVNVSHVDSSYLDRNSVDSTDVNEDTEQLDEADTKLNNDDLLDPEKEKNPKVRKAVLDRPSITKNQVNEKAAWDPDKSVRHAAFSHKLCDHDYQHRKNPDYSEFALKSKTALPISADRIDDVMRHGSLDLNSYKTALKSKNIDSLHLRRAVEHPRVEVRILALNHPKMTKEIINHAQKRIGMNYKNTRLLNAINKAKSNLSESVEQLDEISDDMINNYRKIAKTVVDTKKRGRPSAADTLSKEKRMRGLESAKTISGRHSDKRMNKIENDRKEVTNHMQNMAPRILMAHGYAPAGNTPKSQMFVKIHPEHGLVTHFKLHTTDYNDGYYLGEFGSSTRYGGSGDSHRPEGDADSYYKNKKDVSERKSDAELALRKKINDYESQQKNRALEESVELDSEVEAVLNEAQGSSNRLEKMGKKNSDFDYKKFDNKRYDKKSFDRSKRQMKDDDFREEVEDIDETSIAKHYNYMMAAKYKDDSGKDRSKYLNKSSQKVRDWAGQQIRNDNMKARKLKDTNEELELEESSDKLGDHTLVATRGSEDGNRYELHHKDKNSAVLIRTHKDGRPFKSSYEKHDVMWRGHPLGGKKEINHWMYNTDDKLAKFVNKGDLKEAQCSANRVEKMGKKSSDSDYKKFDNKRYDKKSFDRSKRTMKDDDFREEVEDEEIEKSFKDKPSNKLRYKAMLQTFAKHGSKDAEEKLKKFNSREDSFKEEVEELDEVSKNTLASYISKAARNLSTTSHDIGRNGYTMDKAASANKRIRGIDKAAKKMNDGSDLDKLVMDGDMKKLQDHKVLSNPKLTPDHIHHLLNHDHYAVRTGAIEHPNANGRNIHKALDDEDEEVREAAVMHPNATKRNLMKARNISYNMEIHAKNRLKVGDYVKEDTDSSDDDLLPEAAGSVNRVEPMRRKAGDEYSKGNSKASPFNKRGIDLSGRKMSSKPTRMDD